MQYVVNEQGDPTAVLLTLEEWRTIEEKLHLDDQERDDTTHLMSSPVMRERLLASMHSEDLMGWDEVKRALGV